MKHPSFLCLEVGEARGINKCVCDLQFLVFLLCGDSEGRVPDLELGSNSGCIIYELYVLEQVHPLL